MAENEKCRPGLGGIFHFVKILLIPVACAEVEHYILY